MRNKLLSLCLLFTFGSCTCNYSDGVRVGVPYKLSRKGLVVPTWEGEMNLGGVRKKTDEDGNTQLVPNRSWDLRAQLRLTISSSQLTY